MPSLAKFDQPRNIFCRPKAETLYDSSGQSPSKLIALMLTGPRCAVSCPQNCLMCIHA